MKARKAVVRTSTYPLHLEEPPKIYHVSNVENVSFDPDAGTRQSHHRPVCRHLTYSSFEEDGDTLQMRFHPLTIYHKCIPCRCLTTTIFQVYPQCICSPRRRRRISWEYILMNSLKFKRPQSEQIKKSQLQSHVHL